MFRKSDYFTVLLVTILFLGIISIPNSIVDDNYLKNTVGTVITIFGFHFTPYSLQLGFKMAFWAFISIIFPLISIAYAAFHFLEIKEIQIFKKMFQSSLSIFGVTGLIIFIGIAASCHGEGCMGLFYFPFLVFWALIFALIISFIVKLIAKYYENTKKDSKNIAVSFKKSYLLIIGIIFALLFLKWLISETYFIF